jgi:hypothetical protein
VGDVWEVIAVPMSTCGDCSGGFGGAMAGGQKKVSFMGDVTSHVTDREVDELPQEMCWDGLACRETNGVKMLWRLLCGSLAISV